MRLIFGVGCGWLVVELFRHNYVEQLENPLVLGFALFALSLVPYVVNIGFGVTWGMWPRRIAVIILATTFVIGYLYFGELVNDWAWTGVRVFMLYVYTHLGLSFMLSAVIATPGCEMRSIPHLIGLITGRPVNEHHCPGVIGKIDRWESQRRA